MVSNLKTFADKGCKIAAPKKVFSDFLFVHSVSVIFYTGYCVYEEGPITFNTCSHKYYQSILMPMPMPKSDTFQ